MRSRDDGFTLVELLITIVITGVIVGVISTAMIVGLHADASTRTRLAESHDAQLVSVYLPPDLQSTSGDVVAAPATNTECSGGPNFLRLKWTEQLTTGGATTTYVAAYRIAQDPTSGEWQLVRYSCTNGGAATTIVVAHNLKADCTDPDCTVVLSGTQVKMRLTEASTDGYTYTISGNRRTP